MDDNTKMVDTADVKAYVKHILLNNTKKNFDIKSKLIYDLQHSYFDIILFKIELRIYFLDVFKITQDRECKILDNRMNMLDKLYVEKYEDINIECIKDLLYNDKSIHAKNLSLVGVVKGNYRSDGKSRVGFLRPALTETPASKIFCKAISRLEKVYMYYNLINDKTVYIINKDIIN